MGRALRVLFCANDGLSVGHVTRTLAIARALHQRAGERQIELHGLLVTTSEAHGLLSSTSAVAVVRLPAPSRARDVGFSDADRRRLVRGTIEGAARAFGPDLIVVDTFPSGPHGELASLIATTGAKLALVRRNVPREQEAAEPIRAGLDRYHRVIVAEDSPRARGERGPLVAAVGPITSVEPSELLDRDAARAQLGFAGDARVVLVLAGGGGDGEAVRHAQVLAERIPKMDPSIRAVFGAGPLVDPSSRLSAATFRGFDGVIAPAGYNTAMELTMARVPAVYYARPRPFDDQLGRARSLEDEGLALAFDGDVPLDRALPWMTSWSRPKTAADRRWGGAAEAANVLLDLVEGS